MIELGDVTKTYLLDHGEVAVRALNGVSLAIEDGELVSIMGASGSGKSTLLNILGCLDRPSSGTYRLDGRDASRLTSDERAELRNAKIGFVFQSFNLLPRTTARENVELPLLYGTASPVTHGARIDAVLAAVGLEGLADRLPTQLSGGQQQRVAIARALITDPQIILADEPTGNLDSVTTGEILDMLDRLNESGKTIIMVTHENDVAARARRIIRLHDGYLQSDERL